MSKVYFAKMNINEQIYEVYEGKKSVKELTKKIFSGLTTTVNVFDNKGGRIKFFNLDIDDTGLGITGNLGYIKSGVHSSYDPDKDTAIDTVDVNKMEYITFYFDVENELLGYTVLPVLSKKKVLEYFSELIKKGSGIGVEFIIESNIADIDSELRKYSKISKLEVKLVPPNGDKEDFAELSSLTVDRIQESNSTKITQKFQTQRKDGIDKDSALVQNYIKSVGLGYSEIKFTGKDKSNDDLEVDSSETVPYTRNISSYKSRDHTKVKEIVKSGISALMEYKTKIRLGLKKKK